MELARIEKLLEVYFEGNTSLAEEKELRNYFSSGSVAPQFEKYQPLFESFTMAQQEVSNKDIEVPNGNARNSKFWWYGIASTAVIAITVANFMFSSPSFTQEEQEALTAFNESKKAMVLLSENLNKGTSQLAIVNQFTESKNRILK